MSHERMNEWDEFNRIRKERKLGKTPHSIPSNSYTCLLSMYKARVKEKLSVLPKVNNTRIEVESCLDLLSAVFEYRREPDADEFLSKSPGFNNQRYSIHVLWNEFNRNTPEEMADLVRHTFRDIEEQLGGECIDG